MKSKKGELMPAEDTPTKGEKPIEDKPAFEMNEEQQALFDKLTLLQQEIALNHLSGMNGIDSYMAAKSGKAKTKSSMENAASHALNHKNTKAFLESMKRGIVSDSIMSRVRMMEIQTKLSEFKESELNGLTLTQLTELKGAFDVKLKAMKQLAELAGYEAPKQIETIAKEELTPWDDIEVDVDG